MGSLFPRRLAVGVIVGVCAAALWLPATSRAQDSLEKLRKALNAPLPTTSKPLTEEEYGRIAEPIKKLKTISELRRAYFLGEWRRYFILGPETRKRIDV